MTNEEIVQPKRTRHKRCFLCGLRLNGGRGVMRTINDIEHEIHRMCADRNDAELAKEDNAFGMEE